jgi:hypothetical protein
MRTLAEELDAAAESTVTANVVTGLLSVLPFAPAWSPPAGLAAAAARLDPELAERVIRRAETIAREDGPQRALAAFAFLDKGDAGIAVFSGLRGAVKAYKGDGDALETDPQQAADAGLKALGVAWAAWRLFDGSPDDRAKKLLSTEAGRALLTWFVAADVVLPFADNVADGGAALFGRLVEQYASPDRLAMVAGPEAAEATGMLKQLTGTMTATVTQAAAFARPLSEWAGEQLPGMLSTADKVAGVAATGADALAAYRLLGSALVAEVCLARALDDVRAQVAAEHEAAEQHRRELEAETLNARLAAVAAAEEARKDEEARLEAERAEAEARMAASAQREQYTLDAPEPAASLSQSPIKVTKSGGETLPVKPAGCFGCASVGLAVVLVASAAVALA